MHQRNYFSFGCFSILQPFKKFFVFFAAKMCEKKVYRLNKKLINQFSTDAQAVDWFCSERSAPTLQGNLKIVACNI